MPRTIVVDSGAVSRQVKRLIVVDSGGVSRQVKRCFVVDSGGVSRLIFASTSVFTMVAGQVSFGHGITTTGFSAGLFGTLTPSTDLNGNTIQAMDNQSAGGGVFNVTIDAASNPGSTYFTSVTFTGTGGATFLTSAASYGYSGGQATWSWSAGSAYLSNGSAYTVTIDY